jgi:hypothetical protein
MQVGNSMWRRLLGRPAARRQSAIPIFVFWEPAGTMPHYVRLCMETWANISEAEIILLDYSTMGRFFKNRFSERLFNYTLPQQADAIRFAILAENGGLWLDADTIAIKHPAALLNALGNSEVAMFGTPGKNASIAIMACRSGRANFVCDVLEEQIELINGEPPAQPPPWHYIGMPAYRRFRHVSPPVATVLDWRQHGVYQEALNGREYGSKSYREFWFRRDAFDPSTLSGCSGLIGLHNSWTPQEFKRRSRRTILKRSDEVLPMALRYALSLRR